MKEGIPQYKLKDYSGEIITGTFDQNQLNKAYEQDVYFIDNIIKSRKKAGKKEHLVRWKGWGPKYDSWISEADMQTINRLFTLFKMSVRMVLISTDSPQVSPE